MGGAVIQDSFGGSEVLEVRDVKEPQTGPGEVRVRVSAAALNPVDWKLAASAEIAAVRRHGVRDAVGLQSAGDVHGKVGHHPAASEPLAAGPENPVCRPRPVTGGTPELPRIASTKYATRAAAT
jgi:hypothetical protein